MKKMTIIAGLAISSLFVACGPSAEQKAADAKRVADSTANAMMEQAKADSLKMAAEASANMEKMKMDSIAMADKAKMMEDSIAAAAKLAGKPVPKKVVKPKAPVKAGEGRDVKENKTQKAGQGRDAVTPEKVNTTQKAGSGRG
jgi:hypothetical protein